MGASPTRRACWLLAASLTLVSACAGRHQTIEYTPLGGKKYHSRKPPAVLSEQSADQLVAAGYVPVGTVSVIRVTTICYETCKKIEHRRGTTDTLLTAAGKRGGDLVVLEQDNVEITRDVEKLGPCLESYIQERPLETFVFPVGTAGNRFVPVPGSIEVCTRFAMLHGHETFQQSSGVVWRRE